jgi:hypothetical protein
MISRIFHFFERRLPSFVYHSRQPEDDEKKNSKRTVSRQTIYGVAVVGNPKNQSISL